MSTGWNWRLWKAALLFQAINAFKLPRIWQPWLNGFFFLLAAIAIAEFLPCGLRLFGAILQVGAELGHAGEVNALAGGNIL